MKRLRPLLSLILIGFALLLSAASKGAEEPRQPQQGTYTQAAAKEHSSKARPFPTNIFQSSPQPTANTGGNATYNRYYQSSPFGNLPAWLEAISTIFLVGFAIWQSRFIRRSTEATEKAATATRDAVIVTEKYVELTKEITDANKRAAEAAHLALNAERPYVLLKPLRIEVKTEKTPDFIGPLLANPYKQLYKSVTVRYLSVELRNQGKGIAIIEKIYLRQCVAARKDMKIARGETLPITGRIIGSGEVAASGTYVSDRVAPPYFDNPAERFAVVGYVSYRDVYDRRYRSTFGYFYNSSTLLTPHLAFFFLAAEKHNRIYEEK